jgi:hypothetical protein
MKSVGIKNELTQANTRLTELIEARRAAADSFQNSQSDFIAKKISLDDLQVEQSKLGLLDRSIESIKSRRDELETQLEAAQKEEAHADTLASLKKTAEEAEKLFNDYLKFRKEFDDLVAKHGWGMFDALLSFRNKQREFLNTFNFFVPGILSVRFPGANQRPKVNEIAGELEQIGLNKEAFDLMGENQLQTPTLDYAGIIDFCLTNLENRKNTEEQRKRREARSAKV